MGWPQCCACVFAAWLVSMTMFDGNLQPTAMVVLTYHSGTHQQVNTHAGSPAVKSYEIVAGLSLFLVMRIICLETTIWQQSVQDRWSG